MLKVSMIYTKTKR